MSQNRSSHHLHPLQKKALEVHQAFELFGQNVNSSVQDFQHKFGQPLGELASGAARMVHHFQQQISSHFSAPLAASQMAFAVSILTIIYVLNS
jgi:hypothetical protein